MGLEKKDGVEACVGAAGVTGFFAQPTRSFFSLHEISLPFFNFLYYSMTSQVTLKNRRKSFLSYAECKHKVSWSRNTRDQTKQFG